MWRQTLAGGVLYLMSAEYSVVMCGAWLSDLTVWLRLVSFSSQILFNVQEQGTKFLSGIILENIDAGGHYNYIFF